MGVPLEQLLTRAILVDRLAGAAALQIYEIYTIYEMPCMSSSRPCATNVPAPGPAGRATRITPPPKGYAIIPNATIMSSDLKASQSVVRARANARMHALACMCAPPLLRPRMRKRPVFTSAGPTALQRHATPRHVAPRQTNVIHSRPFAPPQTVARGGEVKVTSGVKDGKAAVAVTGVVASGVVVPFSLFSPAEGAELLPPKAAAPNDAKLPQGSAGPPESSADPPASQGRPARPQRRQPPEVKGLERRRADARGGPSVVAPGVGERGGRGQGRRRGRRADVELLEVREE